MYTYDTATVGSQAYSVYGDVADGDLYMAAAFHGATWRAATSEAKAQALVTVTRLLDRQLWRGDKTDAEQALQWPRKSTGIDGVTDDVIPLPVVYASFELALALMDGTDVQSQQNTAERVQSIRAGSVAITNFRSSTFEITTRFPQIVMELLGPYLAGSDLSFGAKSFGTDRETGFPDDEFGFSRGL